MAAITPKLHVLQYEFVDNVTEKRAPYRVGHLEVFGRQMEMGNVIIGGPVDYPPTGTLTIFRNLTFSEIEQVVQQDPYVINGIVKSYTIKPYMAVGGDPALKDDLSKI